MAGSIRPTALLQGNKKNAAKRLRSISSQSSRKSDLSAQNVSYESANTGKSTETKGSPEPPKHSTNMPKRPPLSVLPLSAVVRSLAITTISSSFLLRPSLSIMAIMAHSHQPLLNPDRNPLLRWFLKKTFYVQFCAGENAKEVSYTIKGLKDLGYKGVILGYAREVVMDDKETSALKEGTTKSCIDKEILPWKKGTLETVELAGPDDFVALKFTGAGSDALYSLSKNLDPSPALDEAITAICDLALARGVRLLFDAEQQSLQAGIDSWTLKYMKKYNSKTPGRACIYGTYQAYLKAIPSILSQHLALAQKEGFTLGVKLVRGAYLGSDPRHLMNDTKEDTDAQYDGIAEGLMRRSYNSVLKPASPSEKIFPPVNVVLATHNHTSVQKAHVVRSSQSANGEEKIDMVYAQLQGMADEVSCDLLQGCEKKCEKTNSCLEVPRAYKYLVWGTTGECMKYLLRRAEENRDAVQRTKEGRDAAASEVVRRVKSLFGLGRS